MASEKDSKRSKRPVTGGGGDFGNRQQKPASASDRPPKTQSKPKPPPKD